MLADCRARYATIHGELRAARRAASPSCPQIVVLNKLDLLPPSRGRGARRRRSPTPSREGGLPPTPACCATSDGEPRVLGISCATGAGHRRAARRARARARADARRPPSPIRIGRARSSPTSCVYRPHAGARACRLAARRRHPAHRRPRDRARSSPGSTSRRPRACARSRSSSTASALIEALRHAGVKPGRRGRGRRRALHVRRRRPRSPSSTTTRRDELEW